jgi:hypothetical protein
VKNVSVEQMEGRNGRSVPNQFMIRTDEGVYFQSYASVIAFKPFGPGKITLDAAKWDYSRTTGKYRNDFLDETKAETEKKIKNGTYILADLNP